MAIKKSELYSSLWEWCNKLRGSMDASQYKDYVLVILFMKYVSDKYDGKSNAPILIPEGGGFKDIIALKNKATIGDDINKIIAKLAEENDLVWIIDKTDFNDDDKLGKWKEMVDRLSSLIWIFENKWLDFSGNKAEWDDIIGDAYEFLMRHFASESGKSKGQFYTPAEVSRIMAKIIGIDNSSNQNQTVYDPACWSGSLLLKAADEAPNGLTIYGQEMDGSTWALAKMNMILHGNPGAEIQKWYSTLSSPKIHDAQWNLKTFDYIVANPPFSSKDWSSWFDPLEDIYRRFEHGIPPTKNGDYAFLLHIITSLKSTWKGAVILPHGVLFRWNAEAVIREKVIRKWYIKWIIGLPSNLFYGTGIPACIILIDKEDAIDRKGIFMIDASKGFIKDWNKNRLRSQDIHKIVDTFNNSVTANKYSRFVTMAEIEKNEYNLNIPRYIDTSEEEDLQNIDAHLKGWIPNYDIEKLSEYFDVCPSLKGELFEDMREWFSLIKVSEEEIKNTILVNSDYLKYKTNTLDTYSKWKIQTVGELKNIDAWAKPKETIAQISESLLTAFDSVDLISKYDMYQHLMDYWSEVMQDDLYMISIDGWKAETHRVIEVKNKKEVDKWWACDLIPKELIVNKYFSSEHNTIVELIEKQDEAIRLMEEMVEENSWDEGLIEDAKAESGNITKGSLTSRMKEIKWNDVYSDEEVILKKYLQLLNEEATFKKQIKEAETELDKLSYLKYPELTVDEIKELVVEDKWLVTIDTTLDGELDRVSQTLTGRINELANRYNKTLSQLGETATDYESKVTDHLAKMWFTL